MGDERVILLTDMGKNSIEFPALERKNFDPRKPFGKYSFTSSENQNLEIEILSGRCTDTMNGEPFAVSVKLVLDGREMRGCGTGLF